MVRLLGILTGATIAVAILIVMVGVPEFPDGTEPANDLAVPGQVIDLSPEPVPEEQPVALPQPEPELKAEAEPEPEPEMQAEPEPPPLPEAPKADNWYAFWSPFRSEFAANGFVSQLQRTTGLDYRVVKQDIGVYEVAFAYSDDADIEHKLALIAEATGLELPGG